MELSDNSIRLKFYEGGLPKTYSVIDTEVTIHSMVTSADSMLLNSDQLDSKIDVYYRELRFLKNMSFSIHDEDLFIQPVRVFIEKDTGKIFLGRLYDCSKEMMDELLIFIMFYLSGIYEGIDNVLSTQMIMSEIGSTITYLNISLPDKIIDLKIGSLDKMKIRRSRAGSKALLSKFNPINGYEHEFMKYKSKSIDISKCMYRSSKESYKKYIRFKRRDSNNESTV